jgi:sortase A
MTVGRVVLVAGILVLLFIPYLLWGTGLQTARSQSQLRTEFTKAQSQAGTRSTPKSVDPAPGSQPVATAAPPLADPPIGSPVGTITIPSIDLSMVVVEGTGTAQLQTGPGHYSNTPLPGEDGNAAIAGHRTTYLHPFYDLNELVPGDPITVVTLQGIFLFHVTSSQSVLPSDVSVISATTNPTLTLTTCTPRYSASQRLVVHATLVASILAHAHRSSAVTTAPVTSSVVSSTPAHDWTAAILLGLLVAAITTGVWIWERRSHRGRRVAIITGGLLAWLVVVFFFFEALAPLLPASY